MGWTALMQSWRAVINCLCLGMIFFGMTALCHARSLLDIKKSKELRICIVPNIPRKQLSSLLHAKGNASLLARFLKCRRPLLQA